MPVNKAHDEFYTVDLDDGWESIPGYDPRIKRKVLSGTLDTENKSGGLTRLLKFEPGAFSTEPFIHDYWEEVYVISGEIFVGSDSEGKGGEAFPQHTYCCRPPGVYHGPFRSEKGALLLESHYYDPQ